MTTDDADSATAAPFRSLSRRLDREWVQMCRRPEVVDLVRSWQLTNEPFATLGEFLTLLGHRAEPTTEADDLLGRLVTVAASHPTATRIVLQRILPGLLAIVKVEQDRNPRVDAFDVLIGEAWISIVRYRVDRRPTDIAARLLNDARHRAFTNSRRQRVVEEVACDAETLNEMIVPVVTSPFDQLVDVIGEATRRGLDAGAVSVVRDHLTHANAVAIAAAQKLTTRAVRYRRDRAIGQIRRLVAA